MASGIFVGERIVAFGVQVWVALATLIGVDGDGEPVANDRGQIAVDKVFLAQFFIFADDFWVADLAAQGSYRRDLS